MPDTRKSSASPNTRPDQLIWERVRMGSITSAKAAALQRLEHNPVPRSRDSPRPLRAHLSPRVNGRAAPQCGILEIQSAYGWMLSRAHAHHTHGARTELDFDLRSTRRMFTLYLFALSLSLDNLRAALLELIMPFVKLLLECCDLQISVLDPGICIHQLIFHRTECPLLHTSRAQR